MRLVIADEDLGSRQILCTSSAMYTVITLPFFTKI